MKKHRPYELQEYDPAWKKRFLNVVEKLTPIFGDNLVELNHIGSTSITGMVAKPQVDVLAVVKDLAIVQDCYGALAKASFVPLGRGYVADDDEYVTQDSPDGRRMTSVHILEVGNPKIGDYKAFRDYLQVNKVDRDLYIATKRKLFFTHQDNYALYDRGKKEVIGAILGRAKKWIAAKPV